MGPYLSISDRIMLAARLALPYAVVLALFFISFIAAPYPLSAVLDAPFFLMAVYFWSIYRPSLLPLWMAFAFGLLQDLLGGSVLGLYAGLYVLVCMLIVDQRRYLMAQSFMMVWLGFLLVNTAAQSVLWLVYSLAALRFAPLYDLLSGVLVGGAFFPVVAALLHLANRVLPPALPQTKAGLNAQRQVMPYDY